MVTSIRWLIAVVVAGILLAAVPVILLDRALVSYAERTALERLSERARNSLETAELRLGQAMNVLAELARAGVNGCGPDALEAMRIAVFTTTPLKSFSVIDEFGRTLCTHAGMIEDSHAVSREHVLADGRTALSVARFRDREERAARLRLELDGGRSLAVLVAADALLPDVLFDGSSGKGRMRLLLEDGEVVMMRVGQDHRTGVAPGSLLTAQAASIDFPMTVLVDSSRASLLSEYRDVQLLARFVVVLIAVFGIGLVFVGIRRNRSDPETELRKAIANGEIVPFFQPTVDTRNGRVRGAEVLARWRQPDGTLVSPAYFIPLAEQSGTIYELTRTLMRRARDEVAAVYGERPQLRLGFNLFAGHFADLKIVEDMRQIFEDSPVSLHQLVVEVTERTPLNDLSATRRVIERLQSLGIKVAIDDVGTGHGGLSYLLKLGVDIIKIDKMFVDAIGTERYSQTIIETLVELARTMNMEVIAEGVETLEQVEYLRLKGVMTAQGFVFAPPLPAGSFLALVEAMERPLHAAAADLAGQSGQSVQAVSAA